MNLAVELPPLTMPIMSYQNVLGTGVNIHCFGKGFPWTTENYRTFAAQVPHLREYMKHYGLSEAVVPDLRGFNGIVAEHDNLMSISSSDQPVYKTYMGVDGILLRPKLSAFLISADCLTTIVIDRLRRRVIGLHCGRDALHPIRRDGTRKSEMYATVVDTALRRLMPTNMREVYAYNLCGIGADSFPNRANFDETLFHKKVVEYFIEQCGGLVVEGPREEGRLNLSLIVETQLGRWGIPPGNPTRPGAEGTPVEMGGNIFNDTVDTFIDQRFSSRRRGDKGCNCILVDMEHAFQ